MKNAIILHGCPEKEYYYKPDYPSESNAHWLPWLQKELILRDIRADTPEIPHSYDPKWDVWCREVERFDITPQTILVGHSAGAGFWLEYLCVNKQLQVGKVVLVAPWFDPNNTIAEKDFFDFTPDDTVAQRTAGITVFYAPDDSDNVTSPLKKLKGWLKDATFIQLPDGYGHATYHNLGTEKFEELRDEILA